MNYLTSAVTHVIRHNEHDACHILPKCLAQALCCFAQGGYCGLNLTTNIISSKTRLNVKYVAHDGTAEQT